MTAETRLVTSAHEFDFTDKIDTYIRSIEENGWSLVSVTFSTCCVEDAPWYSALIVVSPPSRKSEGTA